MTNNDLDTERESGATAAEDDSTVDSPASESSMPVQTGSKRSIYLLPNLLTTGAMFAGFYAILASLHGNYEAAGIAIFAAMFFDGLDGRVARMTNTQSDFGVEYDSLSDMVSFGVAPSVLAYVWMLEPLGKLGWSAAFIYTACAALRLARFNVKSSGDDKRYFIGLASPPAAAILASSAWVGQALEPSYSISLVVAAITAGAGLLMVSGFKYYSFKEINLAHRVPFTVVFALVMLVAVVMIDPPKVLMAIALCYACYAPILYLYNLLRRRKAS